MREIDFDVRYRNLYGARAGYLPANRGAITPANQWLKEQAASSSADFHPSVEAFRELLNEDGVVRMLVSQMIEEVPDDHRTVDNVRELLQQLNYITTLAPHWQDKKKKRHFFPMSVLFTYMMMTPSGEAVFRNRRLNDALRMVLRAWCGYLDSAESRHVLNDGKHGWLNKVSWEVNKLDDFVVPDPTDPHGGFASFNAFFHREIRPEKRPIADPDDDHVVVSANDGTIYRVARDVALETTFWIKAQPYSVRDMLAGHPLTSSFEGGDVLQSYLSGADYHRWHAPVSGKIVGVDVVEGLMFSNLASEGNDIKGTGSQGYYTAVNTRGLCFIEADHKQLGIVCVMPVGITEISSISHSVKSGQHVIKGQELGKFSYGGSSLALLFQKGAINHFTAIDPDNPAVDGLLQVNGRIAVAN
jgi:phosphatidylserine decarboxylase